MTERAIGIIVPLTIGAIFWQVPMSRRRDLFFGVRVEREWAFSSRADRIALVYRAQIAAWTLIALIMAFGPKFPLAAIAQSIGAVVACAIANRGANPHASRSPTVRLAPMRAGPEHLNGLLITGWLSFIALFGTAVWLGTHGDSIPERFPVHFDIHGNANRWAQPSWKSVYGPLMIGGAMIAMMNGIGAGIVLSSPRGTEWTVRSRRATLRVLAGTAWLAAALFSYIALSPALGYRLRVMPAVTVLVLATVALTVPLIRLGSDTAGGTDGTPDAAWKMGMIYYNPGDPALMVQKRFGLGYTVNFAKPLSWVLLAAAAAVPILAIAFSRP